MLQQSATIIHVSRNELKDILAKNIVLQQMSALVAASEEKHDLPHEPVIIIVD